MSFRFLPCATNPRPKLYVGAMPKFGLFETTVEGPVVEADQLNTEDDVCDCILDFSTAPIITISIQAKGYLNWSCDASAIFREKGVFSDDWRSVATTFSKCEDSSKVLIVDKLSAVDWDDFCGYLNGQLKKKIVAFANLPVKVDAVVSNRRIKIQPADEGCCFFCKNLSVFHCSLTFDLRDVAERADAEEPSNEMPRSLRSCCATIVEFISKLKLPNVEQNTLERQHFVLSPL